MRKLQYLILFVYLSVSQFALAQDTVQKVNSQQAPRKISLQQAIELTLQNNLQIKQAKFTEATTDEVFKQSKYDLLPTLSANSGLNFNFGRNIDPLSNQFVNQAITSANGSIFSSVTLFQGFQKLNQIAQNKAQLDADKSNTRKIQNDLTLSVVTTYLQVINSQDVLTAANQQLAISKQQLDREQKFYDVGNRTLADLSQAKAQVATSELDITNAQNQLDLAFLNLSQLMELDPAVRFEIEKPDIDETRKVNTAFSAPDVYKTAVNNYPDIKLAEYQTLAAAKAVSVARGGYYPSLQLQGSLGSGYSNGQQRFVSATPTGTSSPIGFVEGTNQRVVTPDFQNSFEITPFQTQVDENFNQAFGFQLTIPIFNGLLTRSQVRRAKISLQNAEVSEQLAKNNLNKIISQAVFDLRAAEKTYNSAQTEFQSRKDAFEVINQRYNVGLVNSLDFNQAQIDLNQAEFNLIQARYDLIFRSKVIDFYLGNPLTLSN